MAAILAWLAGAFAVLVVLPCFCVWLAYAIAPYIPTPPPRPSAPANCVRVDGYDVCRVDFADVSCFFWDHEHRAISCVPTARGVE